MFTKKKLQNIINNYFITIKLLFSGKNNLPLIPYDIQDLIIEKIYPKNNKINFNTEVNNEYYNQKEVIKSIQEYFNSPQLLYGSGYERKKEIIKLFDYLIYNSKFVIDNYKFALSAKNKLKQLKLECKKEPNSDLNQQLYNKIEETSQKIFGIKLKNYCAVSTCINCQSTITPNFNLCHIHLNKKFKV